MNLPVPAYTRGPQIRDLIEREWMPRLDDFRPEMIFVSAGFDAHRDDDLGRSVEAHVRELADLS